MRFTDEVVVLPLLTDMRSIQKRETASDTSFQTTQPAAASSPHNVCSESPFDVAPQLKADANATATPMRLARGSESSNESKDALIDSSMDSATPGYGSSKPKTNEGIGPHSQSRSSRASEGDADRDYIDSRESTGNTVVSSDLGEGLDAVILERGGQLERVVMNLRKGAPTVTALLRLSRELLQVADAIQAEASAGRPPVERANSDRPDVTDLLHHIDDATGAGIDLAIAWTSDPSNEAATQPPILRSENAAQHIAPTTDFVPSDIQQATSEILSPATHIPYRESIDMDVAATLRPRFEHCKANTREREAEAGVTDMDHATSRPRRGTRTWQDGSKPGPRVPRVTITEDDHGDGPILPSHILKARDIMTPTLAHGGDRVRGEDSPPIFPRSPAPLLHTASAQTSLRQAAGTSCTPARLVHTWEELTEATAPSGSSSNMVPPPFAKLKTDRSIIQKAMSMNNRTKAACIQEAAAREKQTRKQRRIGAQAWASGVSRQGS